MQMNGRVLAAGLLIACATPLGFGVLPALAWRRRIRRNCATARARPVPRVAAGAYDLIVALQAGAAMILMVQIGLFIRTTWKLSQTSRPASSPRRC